MKIAAVCLIFGLVLSTTTAESVSSHLGASDKLRLRNVFSESITSKDLSLIHYSIIGFKLLNEDVPDVQNVCKTLKDACLATSFTTEQAFYIASSHKALKCTGGTSPLIGKKLSDVVESEAFSVLELYQGVLGKKSYGIEISSSDRPAVAKKLQALLKKDDSLASLGYAFYIAAELGPDGEFALDRIEDAVVQADEVDGKMLQFEGGLSITALVLSGSLKLSAAFNKVPITTPQHAIKFATYLMSRRSVQTPKGAAALLEAIGTLADSKHISPACISIAGSAQISAEKPLVSVRVCDLMGRPLTLPADSVLAQSATRQGQQNVVVLSKQKLTVDPNDKTLYTLDLLKVKPDKGMYKIVLSAGQNTGNLIVKVLGRVAVKNLELSIGDADQVAPAKKQTVSFPNKLSTELEADSQQKLTLKVLLTDETSGQPITVHQAFVKLQMKGKQEIIFVAEPDSTQTYKFEMDVGAKSIDFGHRSGLYVLELIVGDAVLSNSFKWHVADIKLKFSQEALSEFSVNRGPRQEIIHKFREPEKRPLRMVSNLFTGLCAAPLLLLFVLWFKLGINVSNFSFTPSALVFHAGFASILSLFGIFWLQLDMFQTLKWLAVLGFITFISGNRLLHGIASQRKGST